MLLIERIEHLSWPSTLAILVLAVLASFAAGYGIGRQPIPCLCTVDIKEIKCNPSVELHADKVELAPSIKNP